MICIHSSKYVVLPFNNIRYRKIYWVSGPHFDKRKYVYFLLFMYGHYHGEIMLTISRPSVTKGMRRRLFGVGSDFR